MPYCGIAMLDSALEFCIFFYVVEAGLVGPKVGRGWIGLTLSWGEKNCKERLFQPGACWLRQRAC